MKAKKWSKKFRRFFSLNKNQVRKDDNDNDNHNQKKKNTLPWSPEDIFDELSGAPIDDVMHGSVLLVEVGGGVERGWVLDFTGNKQDSIYVARYDIPQARIKAKRAPSVPPAGTYNDLGLKALPWIWYKDRRTFSKIETGKLKDMVAFVTGRIALSGSQSSWEGIEPCWDQAKKRVQERRNQLGILSGNGHDANGNYDDVDDDEDDGIDEEARIIATYKPEVVPRDPRKIEFWKRHFGTDMLVGSYLWMISSAAYMFYTIYRLKNDMNAHTIANAVAGVLYTLASVYFVKLSYPENMMLMAYHVMAIDPQSMTFIDRYFMANEMLIASWFFFAGFVIPYIFVIAYEFMTQSYNKAFMDTVTTIIALPLLVIFNLTALPDAMRANNGRGSSFFFDTIWIPVLRLEKNSDQYTFWIKHLGNDALALFWMFGVIGIVSGVAIIPLVIIDPTSPSTWFLFWTTMPFSVGCVLMLRASYPENMNSSLFFKVDDDTEGEEYGYSDGNVDSGEKTPLVA